MQSNRNNNRSSKRQRRRPINRPNNFTANLLPTLYRPSADPPMLPTSWTITRWIPLNFTSTTESVSVTVTPQMIYAKSAVSGPVLFVRQVALWGGVTETQLSMIHMPTGKVVSDSGTFGAVRPRVGLRLPPVLSGPFLNNSTTSLFAFVVPSNTVESNAEYDQTVFRALVTIVTSSISASSLLLSVESFSDLTV